MKSQASFETLMIMGTILTITLIFIVINTDISSTYTSVQSTNKIKIALKDIARESEIVYSQGQGAKSRVFVSIPPIVKNSSVKNKTFLYYVYTNRGSNPIYEKVDFNITGNLPNSEGNFWVNIESFGGEVNVSS